MVTRGLVLFGNSVSANTTSVLSERNSLFEGQYVLEVSSGLGDGSALDGLTDFAAVLEVDSQMGASGLGGYRLMQICVKMSLKTLNETEINVCGLPLTMLSGSWLREH